MLNLKKLHTLPYMIAALAAAVSFSAPLKAQAQAYAGTSTSSLSPGAQEVMGDEYKAMMHSLETKRLRPRHQMTVSGSIVLRGTPSKAQIFSRGKLILCQPKALTSGTFAAARKSCDDQNPTFLPLSEPGLDNPTAVTPGIYILGFENSIYPGFLYVQPGQTTVINLQQIPVPTGGAVKIFRDLTTTHEQHKMYFTNYMMGEQFFSLAEYSFGDFYVRSSNAREAVPMLDYNFCESAKLPEMTIKAQRLCRAWNQGSFMSMMEMFNFEPRTQTLRSGATAIVQSSIGGFLQWEVRAPGRPYTYRYNRMLVAKRTTAEAAGFVNVLPGKYMIEITDAAGKVTTQKVGAVGPTDASGNLLTNFGWIPQGSVLKLEGAIVQPNFESSPEDVADEVVAVGATCQSSKMWRTELRAYCYSDSTEGCNRQSARMCEPTVDGIP